MRGRDYIWTGAKSQDDQFTLSNFVKPLTGCGLFLHDDPRDRPKKIFDGTVSLHTGPKRSAYVVLPVIPPEK